VPTEILSPAQKAIYEPVAAGLGKLDAKLRNEMQKMINSKEFRAAYGIPADAKLSRQELLGHLIVGPIPGRIRFQQSIHAYFEKARIQKHS
jgi:hypothetical protein